MIQFGTDGWRAIIAEDFTFHNVRIVSQAYANFLKKSGAHPKIAIGFDNRFLSEAFAATAAIQLASNGIDTYLASQVCPTPAISLAVKQQALDGGVMITASHNPANFNGFKIKAKFAGSAPPEITKQVEAELPAAQQIVMGQSLSQNIADFQNITLFDPIPPYLKRLTELVDLDAIAKFPMKVYVDAMFGSGATLLTQLLKAKGVMVEEIHAHRDPLFGGFNPEPIEKNLVDLKKLIQTEASLRGSMPAVGVVLDGDADRVGAMGSEGQFITPHQVFLILLYHLVTERKLTGGVAKATNISSMVDRLAQHFGLPVWETPIGFKYVCELILTQDVLLGGEESGGFGVKGHIPERDGPLCALLILEALAKHQGSIESLLERISQFSGESHYQREDFKITNLEKQRTIMHQFETAPPPHLNGKKVVDTKRLDGVKLISETGDWMLVRPSGTEPLIRLYVEATTKNEVEKILAQGKSIITAF